MDDHVETLRRYNRWQHLCFGALIGLLIVGPAIADLWSTL